MRNRTGIVCALLGLLMPGCGGRTSPTSAEGGGGAASTETPCDSCDDGNGCTVDVCTIDGCEHLGQPSPDACNASDEDGLCVWDRCVLQACGPKSNGYPCFAKGGIGTCSSGNCGFCLNAAECDDGNPCTDDYCMPSGCYNPEDTKMTVCGVAGHCFKSQCCEGCVDPQSGSCVVECPSGQTCSPQGTCAP